MSDTVTVALVRMVCGQCGCVFGLADYHHNDLRSTGKTWYCPNGHPRCYRESDVQQLEKQLARERAAHDQTRAAREAQRQARERAERRAAAARGQVTKIRNRVGNGVCPCCNRSFQDLHRHMATKHPTWKRDDGGGQ